MKTIPFVAAIAGVLLVSACGTAMLGGPPPPRTEAYRVHNQQIAPAPIALAPVNLARANDPAIRAAVSAVRGELSALGFTQVADVGQAELLGSVGLSIGTASQLASTAPAGLSGNTLLPPDAPSTGLVVEIRRRSGGAIVWQGRAATFRPPPGGDPSALAGPLAHALFLGFPGESGRTIRAP